MVFVLLALPSPALAVPVNASARVSEPITIVSRSSLDFGLVLPGSGEGKVVVTPDYKRNTTGRVKLLPGIYKPAMFHLKGAANRYYNVTTPDSLMFEAQPLFPFFKGGEARLQVVDFTTYSASLGGGNHRGYLNRGGMDFLTVGGTLLVPANVKPGYYKGLVPITVAY